MSRKFKIILLPDSLVNCWNLKVQQHTMFLKESGPLSMNFLLTVMILSYNFPNLTAFLFLLTFYRVILGITYLYCVKGPCLCTLCRCFFGCCISSIYWLSRENNTKEHMNIDVIWTSFIMISTFWLVFVLFLEITVCVCVCVCESVICFHLLWYDQGL